MACFKSQYLVKRRWANSRQREGNGRGFMVGGGVYELCIRGAIFLIFEGLAHASLQNIIEVL